jgi:hypothetical protein
MEHFCSANPNTPSPFTAPSSYRISPGTCVHHWDSLQLQFLARQHTSSAQSGGYSYTEVAPEADHNYYLASSRNVTNTIVLSSSCDAYKPECATTK